MYITVFKYIIICWGYINNQCVTVLVLEVVQEKVLFQGWFYLEAMEVSRLEVIGRASTPVHDVLVLTLTPQFTVPVCDAQVVIHHTLTVGTVLQHSVEERLENEKQRLVWEIGEE